MAVPPGSAALSASRVGPNPLAGYVRGYAWLRPGRRTFLGSLAQWRGTSCKNWPCLYHEPTAGQSLPLWGSRGSNSPQADYEPAAFTRLLDPRPVAASNLKARRPPWSAPKHADHSRPGLKNAASRRMRILRVSSAATQLTRAPVPRCVYRCTTAPLHHCRAAPASPGHHPPQHTPLLANRLAQASKERARLEIEAIVAKVVKDFRSCHNLRFHLLHLAARRLCSGAQ